MKEKYALELKAEHDAGKCGCVEGECLDEPKGYLEAIKKAAVLVLELRNIPGVIEAMAKCGLSAADIHDQISHTANDALRRWELNK